MRTLLRVFLGCAGTGAIGMAGFPCCSALAAPAPLDPAAAATAAAGPFLTVQAARWAAQVAPGSALAPAVDAEQTWTALAGWVKVPVGGDHAPALIPLPDPWERGDRDYQRAWYVLRADFGSRLPETLWLRFDAVAHQCDVFVNGVPVGGHLGGFTPFALEITSAAHPGVNTVAISVRDEHAVESVKDKAAYSQLGVAKWGAFGSVAGICGGVYFDARPAVHADHLLIHTSTRKNEIEVSTWLSAPAPAGAVIAQAVYAWPSNPSPVLQFPAATIQPGESTVRAVLPWATANRWSPEHPNLYVLRTTVTAGGKSETVETRFGFREFWTEGKTFMLNGSPIHLLGVSLAHDLDLTIAGNPLVGRLYSRDVLAFDKRELNYRAMRLHASIHPPEAIQAADEIGFLLIDQSSFWSAMGAFYTRGGDRLLKNTRPQFAEWFWRDANNPSVVIFDVENEMIRGAGARTPERERWVLALDRFIKDLDPTRIVEHSGAAWYSPAQETIHVHMQEQYSHVLQDWAARGRAPLIIGEWWIGGRNGEKRLTDGYEYASRRDWQQDEARLYREKTLEMRNYEVAGAMPFWLDDVILGRTSEALRRSYNPKDKLFFWRYPGLRNLGSEALAPVIAFAWPRGESAVAGGTLDKEVVVCNDLEERTGFTVTCDYAGRRQTWQTTLGPAAQDRHRVSFPATASGNLVVTVADATGHAWSGDTLSIHAIAPELEAAPRLARELVVMPAPTPAVAAALGELGLIFHASAQIPTDAPDTILLVPPGTAHDGLGRTSEAVRRYLEAGGRLLVLDQNQSPAWLPIALPFSSASSKSAPEFNGLGWPEYTRNVEYTREIPLYDGGHPAFAGLDARDFKEWNAGDGRVADDLFSRPAAAGMSAGAPYRVLAGSNRRENAALIEATFGGGTAIVCQAQVLEQRSHPGARALLMNLLRYLDGPAWRTAEAQVALAGKLSPSALASLIDLPAESFVAASNSTDTPRVVLAGDGADAGLLDALARSGHTVLVLSRETAGRLPGYSVARLAGRSYAGTRGGGSDDPLFWGVATGNFLPIDESPAKAVLRKYPANARVALGGLSAGRFSVPGKGHWQPIDTLDADGPVAVVETRGTGQLIVTTLEPWNPVIPSNRQLLATLLVNAGVRLRSKNAEPGAISVKSTEPVKIDGRLDDWTNDLRDLNVSPYKHAEPIALGRRDVASGWNPTDSDLSAILYLLHDARHLYLAGLVFSTDPATRVEFVLDGHAVAVDLGSRSLTIGGRPVQGGRIAFGKSAAHELFDTRLLQVPSDAGGATFEAAIPWAALGFKAPPNVLTGVFRAGKIGAVLQLPAPLGGTQPAPLALVIESAAQANSP